MVAGAALPRRHALAASYVAGVIFFAASIWWVCYATIIGYAAAVLFLGLFWMLFVAGFRTLLLAGPVTALLAVPALWVFLEKIRSHIFGGFPWFFAAHPLYRRLELIQIADLTGDYGVSFWVLLVNFTIFLILSAATARADSRPANGADASDPARNAAGQPALRRAAVSAVALSALLTAGIFAYGKARLARLPETPVLKILAVQGNIPQRLKEITGLSEADQMKNVWHILQTYQRLTVEGLAAPGAADARLVVWPETMVTYPVSIGREIRLFLQRDVAQRAKRPFLFGCLHAWVDAANRTKICNSACLMSPSGEILARYDKIHLVLFSEYLPLKNTMKFLAALVPENFGSLTPGARNVLFEVAGLRFGVAVCYEDTMAGRIRSIRAAGADFALNVTNDAWFRQSEELEQHLAISVFRAVESRMGIVRDGNTGLTASIAPTGRIMQTAPRDTPCATILQAYGPAPLSFHVRYGDLFAWACLIFASASLLATYVRARRMP